MWPVHTWLPDAHVQAPTGGSVILAAIMLKMGTYGFLRFMLPIVPDASLAMADLMIVLSLIAVAYIGFVALAQSDMKKLIADILYQTKRSLTKSRISKTHLRLLFLTFFLTLAIPSSILSYNAYEKLRWETFHQHQQAAQSLASEISNRLNQAIMKEEKRSDTDYTFLVLEGDPKTNFLQRSALSRYPVESDLPGIVGYFQVNENGLFSSPLLPEDSKQSKLYGITAEETSCGI